MPARGRGEKHLLQKVIITFVCLLSSQQAEKRPSKWPLGLSGQKYLSFPQFYHCRTESLQPAAPTRDFLYRRTRALQQAAQGSCGCPIPSNVIRESMKYYFAHQLFYSPQLLWSQGLRYISPTYVISILYYCQLPEIPFFPTDLQRSPEQSVPRVLAWDVKRWM